jgi:hypothetical protein
MFFDGASSYEGEGAGVLFVALVEEYVIPFSYRLHDLKIYDEDLMNLI